MITTRSQLWKRAEGWNVVAIFGLCVALGLLFTFLAGWSQVAELFRESEQDRIDREFALMVAMLDIDG
jgi:hypothetical protein